MMNLVTTLNILSACAAFGAAGFWGASARVPIPSVRTTAEAIKAGTGISMGEMNDTSANLAVALHAQGHRSMVGAALAALAATLQGVGLLCDAFITTG